VSAINTVQHLFAQNTAALAAATRYEFAAEILNIAETAGRSFVSVQLEITFHDNSAAATAISSWLIGIKLGSASFSDVTVTDSMAFGSETKGYVLRSGNLASYFNSNFGAGATQTCQVAINFGTAPTINHTAKLIMTYSHDWESNGTRTGQLVIPVESWTGYLTTSLTEIGTNQLPALTGVSGMLNGLGSVSIKDVTIEFDTVLAREDATTPVQLGIQIDSETEQLDGNHDQTLISRYRYRRVYSFSGKAASYWDSAHQIKVRGTQAAWFKAAIKIYVTYTYSESGSTGAMVQSVQVPFQIDGLIPAVDQGYAYTDVEVEVQEPGTITLLQSGVHYLWTERYGTAQAQVKVGSQAAKSYFVTTTPGGMETDGITHRVDSGSSSGAAFTLARGKNTIRIYIGISAGFDGLLWGVSGFLMLNYRSSAKGSDSFRHARTVRKAVQATTDNAAGSRFASWSTTFHTGESWRMFAIGFLTVMMSPNTSAVSCVDVETAAGLFRTLWRDFLFGSGNLGAFLVATPFHHLFQRNTGDLDITRGDPTAGLDWRWCMTGDGSSNPGFVGAELAYTFHGFSYAVAGTVSGYTGSGAGITVDVFNASTGERLASTTTSSGGAFSATVYDNTVTVYATARQSSTRRGRSENGTPGSSTFNINVGAMDTTGPVLNIIDPQPGIEPGEANGFPADYATAKDHPVYLSITDVGPGLRDVEVFRRLQDGSEQVVYRDGAFLFPYNLQSEQDVPAAGTLELWIRYNGGWPEDTFVYGIDLRLGAYDTAGNESDLE
jgi:hypothetical protein